MSSLLNRRRNVPWIHRWSRQIIGAIAVAGAANTAYLLVNKLSKTVAACPTNGCERVLESPYATVLGLPLSLFGLLAYIGMAVFAFAPFLVNPETNKPLRLNIEKLTWWFLFIGATAMTVFSGYLMYIMTSQFVSKFGVEGICYYCVASAIFAFAMFAVSLIGRDWSDLGQLLFTGAIAAMITLIATLAIYAPTNAQIAGQAQVGQQGGTPTIPVVNTSSAAEIELAKYLKQSGAKMYGAYWCSHCHDQKELFGKEAVKELPYVECAEAGGTSITDQCKQVATRVEEQTKQPFGFPTWEINGKFYSGTQALTDLAKNTGYQGPLNFKNGA